MNELLIPTIILLAGFTQSLSGFGLALVSMPLLLRIIDFNKAAPLVALISLITSIILAVYYRQSLKLKEVSRLIWTSLIGIPLGMLAWQNIEEKLLLTFLGFISIRTKLNQTVLRFVKKRERGRSSLSSLAD